MSRSDDPDDDLVMCCPDCASSNIGNTRGQWYCSENHCGPFEEPSFREDLRTASAKTIHERMIVDESDVEAAREALGMDTEAESE